MSDNFVQFNFKEIEPNNKTFQGRLSHFLDVTDPKYYFYPDNEILDGIKTVQKFKAMAKESPDGTIKITEKDKEAIING